MTRWTEILVRVNGEASDAVQELLDRLGSAGNILRAGKDTFRDISEMDDSLWGIDESRFEAGQVEIQAYFDEDTDLAPLLKELDENLENFKSYGLVQGTWSVEVRDLEDKDWELAYQDYYDPIPINRYLTIVPEWQVEAYEPRPLEQVLVLDPGLAFGTGQHPTTYLAIQALTAVLRGGERVYDVGTGSGVLAIAAGLLGASQVVATDIDEWSVVAARQNIALNTMDTDFDVRQNPFLEGVEEPAQVIVANLLANLILAFSDEAYAKLVPGGTFIVSGIIDDKRSEVAEALQASAFTIEQVLLRGDWVAIIAKKEQE